MLFYLVNKIFVLLDPTIKMPSNEEISVESLIEYLRERKVGNLKFRVACLSQETSFLRG